ncbi:MAG: hypothetical protein ABSC06_33525 [Rhodopila sp.]
MDIAAEPDDVGKAQIIEELEELMVAEAAVREDCHGTTGWHQLLQPHEACVLEIVALLRQFVFPDRQPQERRCPPMPGYQIERKCRLPILIEVGPVHRDEDFLTRTDQIGNPAGKAVPDIDPLVAQQPVNLLDRVLGHQASRPRQRSDSLGTKVMPVNTIDKTTDVPSDGCQASDPPCPRHPPATTQHAVGNRPVFTLDML